MHDEERTPDAQAPRVGLTPEAEEVLARADAGGVPLYTTPNLSRIATENGLSVSADTTPNEIIDALRRLRSSPG
jgi:hypothetical protein